jgi:predicted membrane channel-forming protein YqfA (hemolysin III family)
MGRISKVKTFSNSKWVVPAGCVLAAGGYAAVFASRGDVLMAIIGPVIMLAYGGLLVGLSRRSEVAAVLRGHSRDERRAFIDLRATAVAAYAMIVACLVVVFVDLARGLNPGAWGTIAVVGGVSYLAGVILFSQRS